MGTLVPPDGLTRLAHTLTTPPSVLVMVGVAMEITASIAIIIITPSLLYVVSQSHHYHR